MGDAIYRDPFLAARERVRELELAVADREARVTETLVQHVPPELAARLRGGRERRPVESDAPLERLAQAEAELTTLCVALDEAIGLAPQLEHGLMSLPTEPPALPEPRTREWLQSFFNWAIQGELRIAAARLRDLALDRDERARVVDLGCGAIGAQLDDLGAPLAIVAEPRASDILMTMSTSVRLGTPALRLRGAGLVRVSAPFGDPAFDDLFEVDGDDAARALLPKPARNALVELATFDVPSLVVGRGLATLTWRFDPVPKAIDCAAHALARLREVTVELRMLRAAAAQ